MEIRVVDGNINRAVKRLKRKLQQDGLFRELKSRRFLRKAELPTASQGEGSVAAVKEKIEKTANSV